MKKKSKVSKKETNPFSTSKHTSSDVWIEKFDMQGIIDDPVILSPKERKDIFKIKI